MKYTVWDACDKFETIMSNELVCVEMDDTLERVKELFDKSHFYPLRVINTCK